MFAAQELVDMVLDELVDDRETLRACVAVCRSWRPRARLHLFRVLTISVAGGLVSEAVPYRYRWSFEDAASDLEEASRTRDSFVRHVRSVVLQGPTVACRQARTQAGGQCRLPNVKWCTVRRLLEALPNMEKVRLGWLKFVKCAVDGSHDCFGGKSPAAESTLAE